MNDTNDTVVYRHRKPCGEVFYIGIGCEQRPYNKKHRSDFWKRVVKKYPDYVVEVVATGLSWEDACELEELMILEYGRRDLGTGTLINLTDGGEGLKNPSKEIREKISAALKGKKCLAETKQKISATLYGKKHSEESKQKMSAVHKGKKLSKKTKQKISDAQQKLTFDQVQEIRKRYQTEKTSHRKLAQKYGVSKSTITNIINNKVYKCKQCNKY